MLVDAELLYQDGMAHYQRREWQAALVCFTRLREVQPDRQGIEPLLDEVSWFLQLEAVGDAGQAEGEQRESVEVRRPRRRWWIWLAVPLALLLAWVVYTLQGNGLDLLPGQRLQTQVRELRNRGEARLAVGDYQGAIQAFEELVTLVPDDQGSLAGLARARRLRELAAMYARAKEAMESEAWDDAEQHLQAILEVDPAYSDARSLLDQVQRQQRLQVLYEEGVSSYDQADWTVAIERFEEIRSLAPSYRVEAIQESLFVSYLSDGRAQLAESGESLEAVQLAAQRFGSALSIHPNNKQASEERRIVSLYLEGLTAYNREDWQQALTWLEAVNADRPDYAGGRLAALLCDVYVHLGDQQRDALNYRRALEYYDAGLGLEEVDCSRAEPGREAVLLALATPTPTSTATATATPTPLPTATPTATLRPTSSPTPTATPMPTDTPTAPPPSPPPTDTPAPPTATPTSRPPTDTPVPTITPTPPR